LYHPFCSADLKQDPAPHDLDLILCILGESQRRRIRDQRDHRRRLGRPGLGELTVEVNDDAGELPPWAREGLTANYPGIRLARCRVVTVGRGEPTADRANRWWWYGIGSLTAAGAMILGWRLRRRTAEEPIEAPRRSV
jgi:hypothetical protein